MIHRFSRIRADLNTKHWIFICENLRNLWMVDFFFAIAVVDFILDEME